VGHESLLVIGANPPVSSGVTTLKRCALAASLLGLEMWEIKNLIPVASHNVIELAEAGKDAENWISGRALLVDGVSRATTVLLAYGVSEPSGAALNHHREQVAWLRDHLAGSTARTLQVGDGPRHPSRWQRWTYGNFPDLPFKEALLRSFTEVKFN
jgi:hypothetical protein